MDAFVKGALLKLIIFSPLFSDSHDELPWGVGSRLLMSL
jgi:hypothetical protein